MTEHRAISFRMGDVLVNDYASQSNPHRVLMFVRRGTRYLHCLALEGVEVRFDHDDNKLRKVGALDLSVWRRLRKVEEE